MSVKLRAVLIRGPGEEIRKSLGVIEKQIVTGEETLDSADELNRKIWELEQNYLKIHENSGDAVLITDFNTLIVTVNQALVDLLEYSTREEIIGKTFLEAGPIEGIFTSTTGDTVELGAEYQKAQFEKADELYQAEKVKCDLYMFKKDGRVVPVEVTMSLLKDPAGDQRGVICIIRDSTERILAQQSLKKAYDGLEKMVRARTMELEEANTALRVLVKGREENRVALERKMRSNIRELINPYLDRLKESRLDDRQRAYLNILENNLRDMISPFSERLSEKRLRLTPAEIQNVSLIKNGQTTKLIENY